MRVIPAIDILDHQVVQLVGGQLGTERVRLPDPMTIAKEWVEKGAPWLHVIDLDRALGKGDNLQLIAQMVRSLPVPIQVGGGIRSTGSAQYLIDNGAARVIVGTKAIKEPDWLRSLAESNPEKVVLALDVREGHVQLHGWMEDAPVSLEQMFERIEDLPLAAVLYTNVDVEGQGRGIDQEAVADFVSRCPCPVIASGGITSLEDLDRLSTLGVPEAVVGLAIYIGKLHANQLWRRD